MDAADTTAMHSINCAIMSSCLFFHARIFSVSSAVVATDLAWSKPVMPRELLSAAPVLGDMCRLISCNITEKCKKLVFYGTNLCKIDKYQGENLLLLPLLIFDNL